MSDFWGATLSGGRIDYVDIETSIFTIEDIAVGLSKTCRFAGQIPVWFSVAEHVCKMVDHNKGLPKEKLQVLLMHDAPEAFMGDMVRDLKQVLPEYSEKEERLYRHMAGMFGFNPDIPFKVEDNRSLVSEAMQLYAEKPEWVARYLRSWSPYDGFRVESWSPPLAQYEFLKRFDDLFDRHNS